MPDTNFEPQHAAELILFPGCDPKNKLSDLFNANKIASKPELVILNWLVALPASIDPAFAAQSLLIKLDCDRSGLSDDQNSLLTLLAEIACHPRERLRKLACKNARQQRRRHWLKQTQ